MESKVYDATMLLTAAADRRGIRPSVLVAETGLWASPEVHQYLMAENGLGVFFPNIRRCRTGKGEQRGDTINGIYLDANSYANHAIKRAIGVQRENLIGFEACHSWPTTCYDDRYHAAIANLVLLPRALAGLTDHDKEIQKALQYRAYHLYCGWYPNENLVPAEPAFYPTSWSEPLPFTDVVSRALAKRKLRSP